MTGTGVGNPFTVNAPKPIDTRAGKFVSGRTIPFASKAEAFADTPASKRSEIGVRVAIGSTGVEGVDYSYYVYQRATTYPTGGDSSDGWDLVEEPIPANVLASLGDKVDIKSFGVLSTTTWDIGLQPRREYSLTADTDFTTTGGTSGLTVAALLIINPASFVVTINGDSVNVRTGGDTMITVYKKIDGTYYTSSDYATSVPDTTPPTVTSVEAIDAHTIEVNFSEIVNGTYAGYGFSFDNGSPLTDSAATGFGTNKLTVTITETMVAADVMIYGIASSDIEDLSGNPLADTVTPGSVINSIPASLSFLTIATSSGTITQSPTGTFNGAAGAFAVMNQTIAGSTNGVIQAEIGASSNEIGIIGLDEDSTLQYFDSGGVTPILWKWFLFVNAGNYFYCDASGLATDTGVAYATGDLWQLKVTGTAVVGEKSSNGGSTWTTLINMPTPRTTAGTTIYRKICYHASTAATIKNLKG